MWTVYVIENEKGNRYTGMTSNLVNRLKQHNSGKTRTTKNKGQWRYVYTLAFDNSMDARKHEQYMKGGAGKKLIND